MRVIRQALVLSVVVSVGCGGGGDDGPTNPPSGNQTLGSITPSQTTVNTTAGTFTTLTVTARDTENQIIANVAGLTWSSGNQAVAEVDGSGQVFAVSAGTAQLTASLTLAGVTKTATVNVTVTGQLPATAAVSAGNDNQFTPKVVAIARNGVVTYTFGTVAHNVIFGGGGAPASISIPRSSTSIPVTFANNGTFAYQCTIHAGMSGTVYVRQP